MKCSSCNKRLRKHFSYCPSCGSSLTNNEEVLEIVTPESKDSNCSCSNENCSCDSHNNDSNFENFKKQSENMRRKSLFYLFAISSVFIYFSLSIVIILNQLSKIEKKNDEFQSFFYTYINDANPVFIDGLKDGHLTFDKHKVYSESGKNYVEFHLTSHGTPKYNGKHIELLKGDELTVFTSSLIEDLWSTHLNHLSYERTPNLKTSVYIDGTLHSFSKQVKHN